MALPHGEAYLFAQGGSYLSAQFPFMLEKNNPVHFALHDGGLNMSSHCSVLEEQNDKVSTSGMQSVVTQPHEVRTGCYLFPREEERGCGPT